MVKYTNNNFNSDVFIERLKESVYRRATEILPSLRNRTSDAAHNILIATNKIASKQLSKSFEVELDRLEDGVIFSFHNKAKSLYGSSDVYYWRIIQDGRKSGKVPPIKAIEAWIDAKGITARIAKHSKTNRLAKAIAWSQKNTPIQAQPEIIDAIRESNRKIFEKVYYERI